MQFIKNLTYLFFLCLSSVFIIKYLIFAESFKITKTIVKGNSYIHNNIILEIINKHIKDKNILNVNLQEIQNDLHENDFIHQVKLYRKSPSSIIVDILEIEPIGLLEKNGHLAFISEDLKFINANNESINHFSNTPVITNLSNKEINLLKTKNILQKIKFNNNEIYNKLNEIRFKDDKIILILNNYTTIILDNTKYDNSINKFLRFNNKIILQKNKEIESYEYINVSIPNQIIINEKTKI